MKKSFGKSYVGSTTDSLLVNFTVLFLVMRSQVLHENNRQYLSRPLSAIYLKVPVKLRRKRPLSDIGDWIFDIDRFPKHLQIETAGICNLDCPFCLVGTQNNHDANHSSLDRATGIMKPHLFDKILADAIEMDFERVSLYFQGEPTMNRNIVDYVAKTVSAGFGCTISTNGILLDKRNEGLKKYPLALRISADGASEETYVKNRVGGDFNQVVKNMKLAVASRHPQTRVEWQFIVMRNNEHEIEMAKALAKEIGIPLVLKTFSPSVPDLVPKDPKWRREMLPKPCHTVSHMMGIYDNGDVVPCCYDVEGKRVMGNARNQTLKEIWLSEKYRKFRRKVLNVDDLDIEICQSCGRWSSESPRRKIEALDSALSEI